MGGRIERLPVDVNRPAVTGDALLAFRLAHWLDLLASKAPAGGAATQPVGAAREVDNDVRLPSHAAVLSPLPREVRQGASAVAAPAVNAPAAELSVAARAINTVLSDSQPQASVLRGSAPVWPSSVQAPAASGLAAALAQTVSESGLFYESHLAEFAAGARSLAQLEREPQARLALATAVAAQAGPAASPSHADPVEQPEQPAQAASVAIHPQAAPLVHQQLDCLESGVFRWSGEAWPGVPMNWSIEQESEDRRQADRDAQQPASWSTTVSITLPRMGRLDLRLALADSKVRAHIAAHDAQALAQMRSSGDELSRRFAQAGLQVQALQFAQVPEA